MALIDEYKQAIQDVLDGRAPMPPRPSEFPDTDDKLAAQYFAGATYELSRAGYAGKNILKNGLPHKNVAADGLETGESGWNYARNSASKVSFVSPPGLYFDINFTAADGMLQLSKPYQLNGSEKHCADELIGLVPSSNVTFSFDIKSDAGFSIICKLHAMNASNEDVMVCFSYDNTYTAAIGDWTKVVISGTVPENYHEEFTSLANKACRLLLQFSAGGVGHVYLRNIKLEYGSEATAFNLSDWDVSDMLIGFASVPVAAGTYTLTSTISAGPTKPVFSWESDGEAKNEPAPEKGDKDKPNPNETEIIL